MSRLNQAVDSSDHVLGPADALVTLVEYGDYQCPYCGRAHFAIAEVLSRIGNRMRYVFRHFPLTEIHRHALVAAEAAEAADAQGKFWQMHSALFEGQDALEVGDIARYADAVDVDVGRLVDEIRNGVHIGRVQRDVHSAVRSGVNATPSFFLNGYRYEGSYDPESLLAAIRDASRGRTHAMR